jgi:hypothetical protein
MLSARDASATAAACVAGDRRSVNIARARELLGAAPRVAEPEEEKPAALDEPRILPCPCPATIPLASIRLIPGS